MRFYKFCLYKSYFDKGYGLTSYFKYAVAVYGVASLDVKATMIMFFLYGIICWILGWLWYKFGFVDAEQEVSNQYNPLAKQIRGKLRIKKNI